MEKNMTVDLSNRTALVTGATSGIGYQAALDLARAGAFVITAGRDSARCQRAREAILQTLPDARVEFLCADFSSLQQVRDLVDQVNQLLAGHEGELDVLVNNAGLYSSAKKLTADGVELTFAVNHLAPFLLTHLLLPALTSAPQGRVLTVSSNSHYRVLFPPRQPQDPPVYIGIYAYAISKLCNVLFSAEFNRRAKNTGVHAWAIDPGLVNTDIGNKDGGFLSGLVWRSRQQMGTSPELPSRTILHLASAPLEEIKSGLYWKDSQPKEPARLSQNADLARDLWEKSCRLCGINEYFPEN
jgi:NAD(P)-dependent dehydrogenase (short-subunit alcohol dehydrogenase family)